MPYNTYENPAAEYRSITEINNTRANLSANLQRCMRGIQTDSPIHWVYKDHNNVLIDEPHIATGFAANYLPKLGTNNLLSQSGIFDDGTKIQADKKLVVQQLSNSQVTFTSHVKKSAADALQYTANWHGGGTGASYFLQFLDSGGAYYDNALFYDYTNKYWGVGNNVPVSKLHVSGDITLKTVSMQYLIFNRDIADINAHGLGAVQFRGSCSDKTNKNRLGAYIDGIADGAWSTDNAYYAPASLRFFTQDASTTNTLTDPRMILTSNGALQMIGSAVAHGVTTTLPTNAHGQLNLVAAASGGLQIIGAADINVAYRGSVELYGITPADDAAYACVINGAKASGTGVIDMAATAVVLCVQNNSNALISFLGSGKTIFHSGDLQFNADANGIFWDYHTVSLTCSSGVMVSSGEFSAAGYKVGGAPLTYSHVGAFPATHGVTASRLARATSTTAFGNSSVYDDGTYIGIAAAPTALTNAHLQLMSATANHIYFNNVGVAAPAFTTRSLGTKVILYPGVGAAAVDYAIGVEAGGWVWNSVITTAVGGFKWYGGVTPLMHLTAAGVLQMIDPAVAHGMTTILPTNAYCQLQIVDAAKGGARIVGATDDAIIGRGALELMGLEGSPCGTYTAVKIIGGNTLTTGYEAQAASGITLSVYNATTFLWQVNGAGRVKTVVPTEYADDAAAATGGVEVGEYYRTASALKIRVA